MIIILHALLLVLVLRLLLHLLSLDADALEVKLPVAWAGDGDPGVRPLMVRGVDAAQHHLSTALLGRVLGVTVQPEGEHGLGDLS